MAKGKELTTPAPVTLGDRELIADRVKLANATINEFVATVYEGVRGKIDELRVELGAELASQRVADAMARLNEINAEVKALADEAVDAPDPVTFRLLLMKIAILKTTFTGRYRAAMSSIPGAPDEATTAKEVNKLFDAVIKDIGTRRKEDEDRPLPEAPVEAIGALTAPEVSTTSSAPEPAKEPPTAEPEPEPEPAQEPPVAEPEPEPELVGAGVGSAEPAEPVASVVPMASPLLRPDNRPNNGHRKSRR